MPVCVVVGVGNEGIGDHCAMKWAAEGYKVAMLARREENLKRLEAKVPGTKGFVCDVTKHESIPGVLESIVSELGPINHCIYNAGSGVFKSFEETSYDEFQLSWSSGPGGVFSFAKILLPAMAANGGGVFGLTGATASWRGMGKTPAFASAKFGVRALSQSFAREYGPKGVHIFHVVIDGVVQQPRTKQWFSEDKPEDEFLSPKGIADHYWSLAQQPKVCWTLETSVAASSRMGDMLTI